jgi:DNA-binding cell septation regulator SpoVG
MPSKADCKGIFRDVAHPVNSAFRRQIETCLLDEYEKFLARKMNFSE